MNRSLLKDSSTHAFLKNLPSLADETELSITESAYRSAKADATIIYAAESPLKKKWNNYIKRIIDILISTMLIVLLFPWLLPLIAILIKLTSKGPVFFLQERNKINGRVFTCIKFRSMHVNSEADSLPASENDQRITRAGKFLRRHHLDELPQLFNVWLGDMSLIGPRPHMISDNKKFENLITYYQYRHHVKPGITGLAQILGYVGPVTTNETIRQRVEQDIYYVCNWSFYLDAKIACRTILKIIGFE